MSDPKIAIILGSTRPGRVGDQVANWVLEHASQRSDATFELLDLRDFDLPLLDESVSPSRRQYSNAHTIRWSEAIDGFDGYIFVTPEYNHSTSAALKNAIDYIYQEWNDKAAAFVSYGFSAGGARAIEHLRQIASELQLAHVRGQVSLSLVQDFEQYSTLVATSHHGAQLDTLLDQLVSWSTALQGVRAQKLARVA